jgi:hypothetical protein
MNARALLVLLSFAVITGCEHTPVSAQEGSVRSTHELQQPPALAARCLARNVENYQSSIAASVRGRGIYESESREVTFRSGRYIVASAHLHPRGEGSTADIWVSSAPFEGRPQIIVVMIADC